MELSHMKISSILISVSISIYHYLSVSVSIYQYQWYIFTHHYYTILHTYIFTSITPTCHTIPTCILSSLVTPSLHNTLHTQHFIQMQIPRIDTSFYLYCWDFKKRIISLATDAMLIYPFTIVGKIFIFSNTKESLLWCNQK